MEKIQITTIDEVIAELDKIIETAENNQSALGYFAALYRKVTLQVKEGIAKGFFEDGPRMEQLDIVFASRYIDAYHTYQAGEQATLSWMEAFNLAEKYWPIVFQHLIIGMNAHINLDLGIAAAQVMEGKDIQNLEGDFDKINEVLASLVHNVEEDLSQVWPALKIILKYTSKFDTFLANFGMKIARDGAWKFAVELSHKTPDQLKGAIKERDVKVAKIGNYVINPGVILNIIFKIVRLGERGTVKEKIENLIK